MFTSYPFIYPSDIPFDVGRHGVNPGEQLGRLSARTDYQYSCSCLITLHHIPNDGESQELCFGAKSTGVLQVCRLLFTRYPGSALKSSATPKW